MPKTLKLSFSQPETWFFPRFSPSVQCRTERMNHSPYFHQKLPMKPQTPHCQTLETSCPQPIPSSFCPTPVCFTPGPEYAKIQGIKALLFIRLYLFQACRQCNLRPDKHLSVGSCCSWSCRSAPVQSVLHVMPLTDTSSSLHWLP